MGQNGCCYRYCRACLLILIVLQLLALHSGEWVDRKKHPVWCPL